MLSNLFEQKKTGYPVITLVLISSCVLVSLPTMVYPKLYGVFGGYKPLTYPWQRFTLAFEHGFGGFPLPLHLGGNMLLLWFCGTFSEKILGSARFLMLSLLAIIVFACAHLLPYIDGHGSSGLIWAYAPVVFVTMRIYRSQEPTAANDPTYQQAKMVLVIMWGIITVLMAVIPYLAGWRGNPVLAIVLGNTFHIGATVAGFAAVLVWKQDLADRLRRLSKVGTLEATTVDRTARIASLAIPAFLLVVMALALLGKIGHLEI